MKFCIYDGFRGGVSVSRGDEIIFEECRGFRRLADELPNEADTRFATASAGKAFVGAGMLTLMEKGLVKPSTPIGDVLHFDLGRIDPAITIEQLLSHTSGAPDYFDESTMDDYAELWHDFPCYRVRTSRDLLFMMTDKPMQNAPGEKFSYNNGGFVLLGLVIEAITGVTFDEYLKKAVFEPCGMTRTGYYEMDRLPGGCADSYIADEKTGGYYTNIFSVDTKGTGAGGAFTTLGDVRRFWNGLFGGAIISAAALEDMLTPRANTGSGHYGLGIWLESDLTPFFQGSDPGVEFVSHRLHDGTVITAVSNYGDDAWRVSLSIRDALSAL